MTYRGDIDGLRAIAVLAVLFYHALIPGFGLGYVGVDIFFVISGYLISRIIFDQIDAGQFSIAGFYERRIRRIFPALFAMMLATTLAGWFLLFPAEFADFGRSLVAALFNVSNLYFLATADYFAEGNSAKPLLHTWSLGVEEQFYIFFPLLCLWVARKAPARRGRVLIWLTVASFLAALAGNLFYPVFNFFSPVTRAWELSVGSLLAANIIAPPRCRAWAAAAAGAGLALLAYSVTLHDPRGFFPGAGSVPPVLGSVLVIWAGSGPFQTLPSRLLALAPLAFIGKISYSLYLWHWPILKMMDRPFLDFLAGRGLLESFSPGQMRLVLAMVSILVATLSWRFIEQPFRNGLSLSQKRLFRLAGSFSLMLAGIGLAIAASQGTPARFPPEIRQIALTSRAAPAGYREGVCFMTSRTGGQSLDRDTCLKRDPARSNYLLLGDSHAAHLVEGLQKTLDAQILQVNASGCKPVIAPPAGAETTCRALIRMALAEVAQPQIINGVILAARWEESDLPQLLETISALQERGLRVYVIGPVVQYFYELPYILANSLRLDTPDLAGRLEMKRFRKTDAILREALQGSGAGYGSIFSALCKDGPCPLRATTGEPLQYDYSHLTAGGSLDTARALVAAGLFEAAEPAAQAP